MMLCKFTTLTRACAGGHCKMMLLLLLNLHLIPHCRSGCIFSYVPNRLICGFAKLGVVKVNKFPPWASSLVYKMSSISPLACSKFLTYSNTSNFIIVKILSQILPRHLIICSILTI